MDLPKKIHFTCPNKNKIVTVGDSHLKKLEHIFNFLKNNII